MLGIPEDEFTPRVRDAIMGLMSEVDNLRRELTQTRARLDEAEKTADQDHMLPLLNRRAFVRELTRYIAFTGRYNTPASLIYFDLNHLKLTNDTLGHAAGDAVLTQFSKVLLTHVRESDCVGRLGGDEFAILLSHATQEHALKKADTLADAVQAQPARMERPHHSRQLRLWRLRAEVRRQCRCRHRPRRRGDVCAKAGKQDSIKEKAGPFGPAFLFVLPLAARET